MKELEGKEAYFLATGNHARNGAEPVSGKVIKVARVNCTYQLEGRLEATMRYKGRILSNGHNSGYIVFESKQAIDDYEEKKRLSQQLARKLPYATDWGRLLTLGQMREVMAMVEPEIFDSVGAGI